MTEGCNSTLHLRNFTDKHRSQTYAQWRVRFLPLQACTLRLEVSRIFTTITKTGFRWRCGVHKPGCSEYHRLLSLSRSSAPSVIDQRLFEMATYLTATALRVTSLCGDKDIQFCSLDLRRLNSSLQWKRETNVVQKVQMEENFLMMPWLQYLLTSLCMIIWLFMLLLFGIGVLSIPLIHVTKIRHGYLTRVNHQ